MDFLWNNTVLAIVSLIVVIVVNFFYVQNINQKVIQGGNKGLAAILFLFSFLSSVYVALFLSLNTGDIGTSVFGFTFAFELVLLGLIYYFALFFNAKKEIKEKKKSKKGVLNKYFDNNAVLGYATAHYMLGIIMLMVLYIFVLPGYIILKTPEMFKNFLNKM